MLNMIFSFEQQSKVIKFKIQNNKYINNPISAREFKI